MKEQKFLGALLPSSPDFAPIIQAVRQKYNLPEISPDDDPINEIYLGDEFVPLEVFRQEIESLVRANMNFMPPNTKNLYKSAKTLSTITVIKELEILSADAKASMYALIKFIKDIMQPVVQLLDVQVDNVVNMIYIYLLTGETEEAPSDWFGKVVTLPLMGEPTIMAIASEVTNLELFIQQIREAHNKVFGAIRPKITDTIVSTAYYLQLKKAKKPWRFIVEEYIRRNKFSLPRDITSKRYFETWHLYEQRLKKRIQRTETILDLIVRDKK